MIIGYARVSTDGQTLDAQHTTLRAAGAEKVFAEKVSGAKTNRSSLQRQSMRWLLATCCWSLGLIGWRDRHETCLTCLLRSQGRERGLNR
jgi:hypothetical protein